MAEHLDRENRSALATFAAYATLPYLWIALFGSLYLLVTGKILIGIPGIAVAGLLCVGIVTGVIPFFLVRNLIKPFFENLLGRYLISTSGCISGLVAFLAICFGVLYFLGRDLELAISLFFAAPVAASLMAFLLSFLQRSGLFQGKRELPPPMPWRVEKPDSPRMPPPSRGRPLKRPQAGLGRLPSPTSKSRATGNRKRRVSPPEKRN